MLKSIGTVYTHHTQITRHRESFLEAMSQTMGLPLTQACLLAHGLSTHIAPEPVQMNRRRGQAWSTQMSKV